MVHSLVIVLLVVIAVAPAATWISSATAEQDQIVIKARSLEPRVLETVTGRRVTFVNRSGQAVHLDFWGDAAEHRVFQVPGEIWAIFHRPGRHPYMVHFSGDETVGLHGVDVKEDPSAGPHTCGGFTVMGTCIEP
jgi:hypothetical protein